MSQFLALVVLHPELPALVQLGERHGGRDARSRGRPAMVMVPISSVTVGASLRTSLGMLRGTSLGALLGPLNPCYTSLGTHAYMYYTSLGTSEGILLTRSCSARHIIG